VFIIIIGYHNGHYYNDDDDEDDEENGDNHTTQLARAFLVLGSCAQLLVPSVHLTVSLLNMRFNSIWRRIAT